MLFRSASSRRTLFGLLDSLDEVVDEDLEIRERVGNVGGLVDLGERLVEDGDDILEELRRRSLRTSLVSSTHKFEEAELTSKMSSMSCSLSLALVKTRRKT